MNTQSQTAKDIIAYANAAERIAAAVLCSERDVDRSPTETILGQMVARLMRQIAGECVDDGPWRSTIEDDELIQAAASLTYVVRDCFDGDGNELQAWLDVARARAETFWDAHLAEIEAAVAAERLKVGAET